MPNSYTHNCNIDSKLSDTRYELAYQDGNKAFFWFMQSMLPPPF
jgi:hypothetical protein